MFARDPRLRRLVVALIVLGGLGWAGLSLRTRPLDAAEAPAGWLIALSPDSRVRLGRWPWPVPLEGARALRAGEEIHLAPGARALLLTPEGKATPLAGPSRTILAPPPTAVPAQHWAAARRTLAAALELSPPRTLGPLRFTAPAGVTRALRPTLDWQPEPGARYDVILRDPEDPAWPPRHAAGVQPPVRYEALGDLPPLRPDRLYEVLLRQQGDDSTLSQTSFLTHSAATAETPATDPAARLAQAAAALAKPPWAAGDAWTAQRDLPAPWSETELAARLRLATAAALGLEAEWADARSALGAFD